MKGKKYIYVSETLDLICVLINLLSWEIPNKNYQLNSITIFLYFINQVWRQIEASKMVRCLKRLQKSKYSTNKSQSDYNISIRRIILRMNAVLNIGTIQFSLRLMPVAQIPNAESSDARCSSALPNLPQRPQSSLRHRLKTRTSVKSSENGHHHQLSGTPCIRYGQGHLIFKRKIGPKYRK